MAITKYFTKAFAVNGDKATVPDATQPDGSVSYDSGFTFDYEREVGDPLIKDVPRDQTNQIYNDITNVLKFLQERTAPEWDPVVSATIGGYPQGARVSLTAGGPVYTSVASGNTDTPGGVGVTSWITSSSLDPTLVSLAGLATGANKLPYFTGTDTAAQTDLTSFARTFLAALDPPAGRSTLGITTATTATAGLARSATLSEVITNAPVSAFVFPGALHSGFSFTKGTSGQFKFPSMYGEFIVAWDYLSLVPAGATRLAHTFPNAAFGAVICVNASGSDDNISTPTYYITGNSVYVRNQDNNQLALFVISLGW